MGDLCGVAGEVETCSLIFCVWLVCASIICSGGIGKGRVSGHDLATLYPFIREILGLHSEQII